MPVFMQFFSATAPPDFFEGYVHELRDTKMLPIIQKAVLDGVASHEFKYVSADEISLIYMGMSTYIHRNFDTIMVDRARFEAGVRTIQGVIEKTLGIEAG